MQDGTVRFCIHEMSLQKIFCEVFKFYQSPSFDCCSVKFCTPSLLQNKFFNFKQDDISNTLMTWWLFSNRSFARYQHLEIVLPCLNIFRKLEISDWKGSRVCWVLNIWWKLLLFHFRLYNQITSVLQNYTTAITVVLKMTFNFTKILLIKTVLYSQFKVDHVSFFQELMSDLS